MFSEKYFIHKIVFKVNEEVGHWASHLTSSYKIACISTIIVLTSSFIPLVATANDVNRVISGNFGMPGIVDLPTARRFPDGEIIITHQNHEYLFMNGISFQALPRLGLSFRYGGHGRGGDFAQGRVNWDRSFDAHLSILDEGAYFPAISLGLRDFIGTGWYYRSIS